MNSKQRRIDQRRWRHKVRIKCRDYAHYCHMWDWLKAKHTGKVARCGWRDRHPDEIEPDPWDHRFTVIWEFERERDAVEFALKWC
jgi:hypothetical protein